MLLKYKTPEKFKMPEIAMRTGKRNIQKLLENNKI